MPEIQLRSRVQLRRRRPGEGTEGARWRRRPTLSRALRVAIIVGPIGASFLIAALLSHLLPRASGPLTAALWIAIVGGSSLLTLVVFERAARRLLPLAALLNVSLLFPDKAPARFAVARRTGSPGHLREQLAQARAAGQHDDVRGMQTVIELVLELSVHDKPTRGHSERVRVFTDMLADELKIEEGDKARLRWAALLHDIGKLEISPTLLNKRGKPTVEEWEVLHRHPEEGARLVAPMLAWLGESGRAVAEHHERWDGTGYPHELRGTEISLAARIVAVADVYEVMTTPRPYKATMSVADARLELTRVAGTQLDPAIVRAFLNISIGRLWRTVGIGAWIGQIPNLGRLWQAFGSFGSWAGTGALSAVTATVLTVGGFAPPAPSPGAAIVPGQPLSSPGVTFSAPPSASSGQTPAVPGTSAAPGETSSPTPQPKSTLTPTATPTSRPNPTPTPLCPTCTHTQPKCTNHCSGNHLPHCTTYCLGNNNSQCTRYCYGANNPQCIHVCVGPNNPKCNPGCAASGSLLAAQTPRQDASPSGTTLWVTSDVAWLFGSSATPQSWPAGISSA
jgi:HD domain